MHFQTRTLLALLPALASAISPPGIDGFTLAWYDDFVGTAGAAPCDKWNIAQDIHTNNEKEVYTTSGQNLQLSGGSTVQFVPQKSSTGQWTSGRIESVDAFTPTAGKEMIIQGSIRFGSNPESAKQGLWPAFWLLGDAVRHGTPWPQCGELDIMEQIDGVMTGYGTAHCGTNPGGPCQETTGLSGKVGIPDNGWHTWTIRWNLRSSDWTQQTITWYLDGAPFNSISGAQVADAAVFSTLAHSPFYILMNVAVGGDWPGAPNDATASGWDSMMEVAYVGVYNSS